MGDSESKTKDFQIGCNLDAETGRLLDAYARLCEVSRSKLLGLLVVRETKLGRLPELATRYRGSEDKRGAKRVSARMMSVTRRNGFRTHVAKHGMGTEDGLALLARAEMDELWLGRAMSIPESELILAIGSGRVKL